MRKVEFKGWVIFDEEELQHGNDMVAQIDHELFNVDGVRVWSLKELNNNEIEYEEEDE